jgi:hypothetical protein
MEQVILNDPLSFRNYLDDREVENIFVANQQMVAIQRGGKPTKDLPGLTEQKIILRPLHTREHCDWNAAQAIWWNRKGFIEVLFDRLPDFMGQYENITLDEILRVKKGELVFPQINISIPIYRGGDNLEIIVRLETKKEHHGGLVYRYILHRHQYVLEAAFRSIVDQACEGRPHLYGTPPADEHAWPTGSVESPAAIGAQKAHSEKVRRGIA